MKAIPIIYEGIQFRSKLEARWYIFMKKLGWNVVYEPEIEGINGWIPDFLIIGKDRNILVDVKPINRIDDWSKHPDCKKILNSGIEELCCKDQSYELLIVGSNLQLDGKSEMGIGYSAGWICDSDQKPIFDQLNDVIFISTGEENGKPTIGYMSHEGDWHCRITGEQGKYYIWRNDAEEDNSVQKVFKYIDTCWNKAWTELRWKGKENK